GKCCIIGHELARFIVLYAKVSTRKHKRWEGDGILLCYVNHAVLKSEDEKDVISRSTSIKCINDLENGKELKIGSWEVQIQERVATRDVPAIASTGHVDYVQMSSSERDVNTSFAYESGLSKLTMTESGLKAGHKDNGNIPYRCFRKKFKCPLSENPDSLAEGPAFIINEDRVENFGEEPIVADPLVSRHLRTHQKEGVRFIFSALKDGHGVILADEMGLGKSIQAIVATMALLKQQSVIAVRRASDIRSYACSFTAYPFLIISYEMALRYSAKLASIRFDILVCDEGHRLKNVDTKLRQTLDCLAIGRRLLLTGTPIQNDIKEFFSLLNFVRPNLFDNFAEFKTMCCNEASTAALNIAVILKDISAGSISEKFSDCFLRRTNRINNLHLPNKNDYILFCAPSLVQKSVLASLCAFMNEEPFVLIDMMRKASNHPAILFKKICLAKNKNSGTDYSQLLRAFPEDYGNHPVNIADSGKLSVFVEMMACFRQMKECVVVISNFTKTLDMLSSLCRSLGFCVLRLDGQTPVSTRQEIVKHFNTEGNPENVFLLSTKAELLCFTFLLKLIVPGGVGLNLTGASRLILFDLDWNPATDMQAMGRIWRDGQEKDCHIYRLVTASALDHFTVKTTWLDKELQDVFTLRDTQCETHDLLNCDCDGQGRSDVSDVTGNDI
uniref:DNA repair and recombination protein RAD54-like n=1 Tax=Angiostrongylus cantonensis TaxID=6313 RepID=A0A0K0DGZ7_ANGCA